MNTATQTQPRPRLLVVDDEPIVCRSCERIFGPHGYDVESTTDSQEGLARALSTTYDAIVLDIKMPSLDGVGFLDRLHRASRRLPQGPPPVIAISGHSDKRAEADARRLGIAEYLPKPFGPEEIRAVVGKAVTGFRRAAWARIQPGALVAANDSQAIDRLRVINRRGERVTLIAAGILRRDTGPGKKLVEALLNAGYPVEVTLGRTGERFRAAIDEIPRCDRLVLLEMADQDLLAGTVTHREAGDWARTGGAAIGTVRIVTVQPATESASPSAFVSEVAERIAADLAALLT